MSDFGGGEEGESSPEGEPPQQDGDGNADPWIAGVELPLGQKSVAEGLVRTAPALRESRSDLLGTQGAAEGAVSFGIEFVDHETGNAPLQRIQIIRPDPIVRHLETRHQESRKHYEYGHNNPCTGFITHHHCRQLFSPHHSLQSQTQNLKCGHEACIFSLQSPNWGVLQALNSLTHRSFHRQRPGQGRTLPETAPWHSHSALSAK